MCNALVCSLGSLRKERKIGSIKQTLFFCRLWEYLSSVKQTISFSNSIVEIKQKSAASARRKSTYFFANTEAKQVQNNIKYLMTSRFKMGIACWRVGFDSLMVATRLSRKSEKRPLTGDGEEPSAAHTTRTDHGQENEYSTTAYAQIQISILSSFNFFDFVMWWQDGQHPLFTYLLCKSKTLTELLCW